MRYPALMLLLLAAFSRGAANADVSEGAVDFEDCASLADNDRRLACYDHAAETLANEEPVTSKATAQEIGVGRTESEPARAELEAAFGMEARLAEQGESLEQIGAKLETVETLGSGKRIFRLDNNQVWAEQTANPRVRLAAGDQVRIKAGSLGSFRLFGTGKKSTRVERVE